MTVIRECHARRVLARALFGFSLASEAGGAWADAFVDDSLPSVKPDDWVRVARRQPVQLMFQFQTNGAFNPEGTELLRRQVLETVRASRLFSRVSEAPVSGRAQLHVVINDAAAAEERGFGHHSTVLLAGATVGEIYEARLDYVPGCGAATITRRARHRIYGQIATAAPAPPNATRAESTWAAVLAVTRDIVANPLNAIAAEPGFGRSDSLAGPRAPSPASAGLELGL